MTDTTTASLTARRDAVIAEHIAAECDPDIQRALNTFSTPHYHVLSGVTL